MLSQDEKQVMSMAVWSVVLGVGCLFSYLFYGLGVRWMRPVFGMLYVIEMHLGPVLFVLSLIVSVRHRKSRYVTHAVLAAILSFILLAVPVLSLTYVPQGYMPWFPNPFYSRG